MLADLKRHQRIDCCCYEQRLPWCWTEEAEPLISQELGLLAFHFAGMVLGIALCWCWQCLLTVGGNWLQHIVTPLDVTTVVWCCRQTHDVLHPAECQQQYCDHRIYSGEHVSSLCDSAMEVIAVCMLQFIAYNSIWHCSWAVGKIQQKSVSYDNVHHLRSVKINASLCCISEWFLNLFYLFYLLNLTQSHKLKT